MKYLSVFSIYVIFSIAACFAGVLGLLGALAFGTTYLANIFKALDKLLAAMLGWDGASTVSRECATNDCAFCRALCAVLSVVIEKDHCKKEGKA